MRRVAHPRALRWPIRGILLALAALLVPTVPAAILDNGIIQIGLTDVGSTMVHDAVLTGVPAPPSMGTGDTDLGVRLVSTGYEGLAGSYSVAWGLAYDGAVSGHCRRAAGPCPGGAITTSALVLGPGTARQRSFVGMGPTLGDPRPFNVLHVWSPEPTEPNAYRVDVTIYNNGTAPHNNVTYRRALDWNVEPTNGNEHITIQGVTPMPTAVKRFTANGAVVGNPLVALTAPTCPDTAYFTDCGPGNLGSAIDLDFGTMASGEALRFVMHFGAARDEAEALQTLTDLGVEVYVLAQPAVNAAFGSSPVTGGPTTFFFALSGLGPPQAGFGWNGTVPAWAPPGWTPTTPCAGSPVTFTDASTVSSIDPNEDPASSVWEFGDGSGTTTAWSSTVAHTYAAPGTYVVNLTVRDRHGLSDRLSATLTVVDCTPPPPPNLAPYLTEPPCRDVTSGERVRFQVQGGDPNAPPDPAAYYTLVYSASGLPPGAAFDATTRTFDWPSPTPGEYDQIRFTVRDGGTPPLSASVSGCITVRPSPQAPAQSDADGDGHADGTDVCPNVADPGQADDDGDGLGDACDPDAPAPEEGEEPPADPSSEDPPAADGRCAKPEPRVEDVTAAARGADDEVAWRFEATCAVDRFLVWDHGRRLLAVVAFDPARSDYAWSAPAPDGERRYWVQAQADRELDLFDLARAVPSDWIAPSGCAGCEGPEATPTAGIQSGGGGSGGDGAGTGTAWAVAGGGAALLLLIVGGTLLVLYVLARRRVAKT